MMKQSLMLAALGLAATGVCAQSIVAPVISATPVVQQVQVPQQNCQPVMVQAQTSGGGAVLGAVFGGLLGNQFGRGGGRAAATAVGVLGGAVVGNSIEASNLPPQAVPHCTTQTVLENRTVGYNVVYELDGRQYTVQMPQDPGPTIRLQLSPMGAGAAPTQAYGSANGSGQVVVAPPMGGGAVVVPAAPAPVVYSPAPMYGPPPVYPAPYYRSYPPVQLNLGVGYYRHGH